MEVAGIGGAFAKEAQDDAVLLRQLTGQAGSRGDGNVAPDDAGCAQVPLLYVCDVHRPAASQAIARGAAAKLGPHLVVVGRPLCLCFRHRGSARVAMAMPAVGACDQVVIPQDRNGAHGHGLLPGIEVRSALDLVLAQQVVHPLLEQSDLPHLSKEIDGLCYAQAVGLEVQRRSTRFFHRFFSRKHSHLPNFRHERVKVLSQPIVPLGEARAPTSHRIPQSRQGPPTMQSGFVGLTRPPPSVPAPPPEGSVRWPASGLCPPHTDSPEKTPRAPSWLRSPACPKPDLGRSRPPGIGPSAVDTRCSYACSGSCAPLASSARQCRRGGSAQGRVCLPSPRYLSRIPRSSARFRSRPAPARPRTVSLRSAGRPER